MRHTLRLFTVVLGAVVGLGLARTAGASCDVPLTIGGASAVANVLILLDNSASMNQVITSTSYNANVTYAGKFKAGNTYSINTSKYYTPNMIDNKQVAITPSAYLVASDCNTAGDYTGNYLNWIYYNATAAQIAAIPVITRIQSAKACVTQIFNTVTGCNFGLEVYSTKGANTGQILCNMGSTVGHLDSTVAGLCATTCTPLAGSLDTAKSYFQTTGANACITASCQKNFLIIVTDGLPTCDVNKLAYVTESSKPSDGSLMDEVAGYMYTNDMRPDLTGLQNVSTFCLGYNVDGAVLHNTALLGGGSYFNVVSSASLSAALAADFNIISARVAAGSAVSVVSGDDRTNNKLYRARYQSQTWRGYVEAFALPYSSTSSALWEAGSLLSTMNPDTRNIITSSTGLNTYQFTLANEATLKPLFGVAQDTSANNIINYIRGKSVVGTRDRGGWLLGDIVDAAPASVGHPNSFDNYLNYWTFRALHANRQEVVYAAANDGQLHCFDAGTGVEQWSYIPHSTLPKLNDLLSVSYCHEFFLNTTPVAYDINYSGVWKTVLIGGQGQAGNGYFALDVTSPSKDTVSVLWDSQIAGMNGAWNPPSLIRDKNRGYQVLAVGTGYNAAAAQGALIVMDPSTGSVLSTFNLGSSVAGNKITRGVAVDRDFDGYEDVMYLGDLLGNLWRVDLTKNPWTVSKLFSCSQPISAQPICTLNSSGQVMVFFGTGEYISPGDLTTTSQQTIYGLTDDGSGSTIPMSSIVFQDTSITALSSGKKGWAVDLKQLAGERVIHGGVLINGTLYVTSFAPDNIACAGGGQSWLYTINYLDGSAPNGGKGSSNTVAGRVQGEGDGILTDPTVDLMSNTLILQSSSAVILSSSLGSSVKRMMVKSWRQKWN